MQSRLGVVRRVYSEKIIDALRFDAEKGCAVPPTVCAVLAEMVQRLENELEASERALIEKEPSAT